MNPVDFILHSILFIISSAYDKILESRKIYFMLVYIYIYGVVLYSKS